MKQRKTPGLNARELQRLVRQCIRQEIGLAMGANGASDKLMGSREASEYLNITRRTLQKWRERGIMPFIRIEGKVFFKKMELLEALERYRVG